MAGNQGTQDWFYHAPAKRKEGSSPVDYPAPSQIPLSSIVMVDEREDDTGMKRGWIRDTDSKYTRMAKMGGRKDLLRFKEPNTTPKDAKPYPRVEWFDHEEAQDQPDENSGPRQIFLPEYMVHEEYRPDGHIDDQADTRAPPGRPPFSLHDKLSAFQRDGDQVTDKRVKLPEPKGFNRKAAPATKKEKQMLKEAAKQSASQRKASQQSQRYASVDIPPPMDKANISKLLSMGYQMDWYKDREKYYEGQQKLQEKQPKWEVTKTEPKATTEYRDYISKQELTKELKAKPKPKTGERRKSQEERRGSLDENKALFKLSRFEKASPRVDTHWSEEYGKDKQHLPVDTYTQQVNMET